MTARATRTRSSVNPGKARAGFARQALAVPAGTPLAGYGPGGSGNGQWTKNPLFVRAMYLEDDAGNRVAFAVVDLMSASRYLHEKAAAITRDRCQLDVDGLVICGTDTHTGPAGFYGNTLYDAFAGHTPGFDRALADGIARTIASTVETALHHAEPATVRIDVTKLWGLSRNRSIEAFQANDDWRRWTTDPALPGHGGPSSLRIDQRLVDPRLVVLSAFDAHGRRLGAFATFACHNTANGPHPDRGRSFFDPDWTGAAARFAEAHPNGAPVVMVALSGVGDQTPLPPQKRGQDARAGQGDARVRYLGTRIGEAICRADAWGAGGSVPISLRIAYRDWWTQAHPDGDPHWNDVAPAPLGNWRFGASVLAGAEDGRSFLYPLLAREGMTDTRGDRSDPQYPKPRAIGPLQPFLARVASLSPSPVHPLHVVQVAGHVFATVPGEPTVQVAHAVEAAVRAASGAASASILGFAGDYAGYFTTRAEFGAQHYEGASTLYGAASAAHLQHRLVELATKPATRAVRAKMPDFPEPSLEAHTALEPWCYGRIEPDRLVAVWCFPAAQAPVDPPVVVALEKTDDGQRPVCLREPIRIEPRDGMLEGEPVVLWSAEIPVRERTRGKRYVVRAAGLETIPLPYGTRELPDVEGGPESTPGQELSDPIGVLRDLLDQQPDGGAGILDTLLPTSDPIQIRQEVDMATRSRSTRITPRAGTAAVEAAELQAFRELAGDALEGAPLTAADVADTRFQTREDWFNYVIARGAIGFHAFGMPVKKPRWRGFNDPAKRMTHRIRAGEDPAVEPLRMALFADFGNGTYMARNIARQLVKRALPYAFHLGDVYYGGSEDEFRDFFEGPLSPMLGHTELFMLAGNHEMYARGEHFQRFIEQKAIRHPGLQRQNSEMFRLQGDGFQVLGIDTMWTHWQGGYFRGGATLDGDSLALLSRWVDDAQSNQLTILLTSDHPWDVGKKHGTKLLEQISPFVEKGRIDLWFWGNVHYAALYGRYQTRGVSRPGFIGSCIGHGGYPFYRMEDDTVPDGVKARWLETKSRFWPFGGIRPDVGLNGWCELALSRSGTRWGIELTYRDWVARVRAIARLEKGPAGGIRLVSVQESRYRDGALEMVTI